MNLRTKHWIYAAFCLIVAIIAVGPQIHAANTAHNNGRVAVKTHVTHKATTAVSDENHMRTPIDWRKSSETVPYPDLKKVKNLWIKVNLKQNRVYLYDGPKVIYTMYCSGGVYEKDPKTGKMKSKTPTGTFHVQKERGDSFFNPSVKVGAKYYVSWKNHGEYLFHSVPTKADGSFDKTEAAKLGKTQGSHGCVRLSVPDAKWMEENLPVGTKVEVIG